MGGGLWAARDRRQATGDVVILSEAKDLPSEISHQTGIVDPSSRSLPSRAR